MNCPLCRGLPVASFVHKASKSTYHVCGLCGGFYRPASERLGLAEEKKRYLLHNYDAGDEGYLRFLKEPWLRVLDLLPSQGRALDWGCGPSPLLSKAVQGDHPLWEWESYDPFFFPKQLEGTFNLVFASECFEHFYDPMKDLRRIDSLLAPKGYLAVSTALPPLAQDLTQWHYLSDPTHVFIYGYPTWEWICGALNWTYLKTDHKRIHILKKG